MFFASELVLAPLVDWPSVITMAILGTPGLSPLEAVNSLVYASYRTENMICTDVLHAQGYPLEQAQLNKHTHLFIRLLDLEAR